MSARAHDIPGDVLNLHHGATHSAAGLAQVMLVSFIALSVGLLSRSLYQTYKTS